MPLVVNPETHAGIAEAVQVNVVATIFEVNITAVVVLPVHMVCCIGLLVILGDGFTLIT